MDQWLAANALERRLIAYLMQFRLKVKYIKGCQNSNAVRLSRIFEDMTDLQKVEFSPKNEDKEDFVVTITSQQENNKENTLMCYSLSPLSHQMETDEGLSLDPDTPCFVPKIQHTVEVYNSKEKKPQYVQ